MVRILFCHFLEEGILGEILLGVNGIQLVENLEFNRLVWHEEEEEECQRADTAWSKKKKLLHFVVSRHMCVTMDNTLQNGMCLYCLETFSYSNKKRKRSTLRRKEGEQRVQLACNHDQALVFGLLSLFLVHASPWYMHIHVKHTYTQ